MSLCPHGYTAFWDCPRCPEPLGTAPDYLDKDAIPPTPSEASVAEPTVDLRATALMAALSAAQALLEELDEILYDHSDLRHTDDWWWEFNRKWRQKIAVVLAQMRGA